MNLKFFKNIIGKIIRKKNENSDTISHTPKLKQVPIEKFPNIFEKKIGDSYIKLPIWEIKKGDEFRWSDSTIQPEEWHYAKAQEDAIQITEELAKKYNFWGIDIGDWLVKFIYMKEEKL